MPAERAIEILESIYELMEPLAAGDAMGLHLKEISRRTCLLTGELPWPDRVAGVVNKVRSAAAWYAVRYERDPSSEAARADNRERLNAIITACQELRPHLELQIGHDLSLGELPRRGRF